MNKFILYTFLFVGWGLLQACNCGPREPGTETRKRTRIQLEPASAMPNSKSNDSIRANSFRLYLTVLDTLISAEGYSNAECPLTPVYPVKVSDLTISSQNDFDSQHPAGSSLNTYFKIKHPSETGNARPISQFISSTGIAGDFLLLLYALPQKNGVHRFNVTIRQADGSVLQATTRPVTLTL